MAEVYLQIQTEKQNKTKQTHAKVRKKQLCNLNAKLNK